MRILLAALGIGVFLFDILLFKNPDKVTNLNYLFNVAYALIFLFGASAAFLKSKKFPQAPNMGRSMAFFSLGMLFFALGLLVWTYYNLVLKISVPYPSFADPFFLIYYPSAILGIYFLIKSFGGKLTGRLIVEGVLTFLVFFGILYFFLIQTSLGPDVTFWAKFLNIAYPLSDSFLIAFAITVLRTERGVSSHPNILYFVFGFLILAAADTAFSYQSANNLYWNGNISDFLFAVSGFLTSWGILSIKNISLTDHSYS
jgi:hypothetical protein